ncbi:OmpA family protein [Nitrosomonas sp.]|uniref:OmpA family protein n=1 Tax=Nitrosomonas sp. TaxID=42353 RepID=UPI0025CC86D2|nr:OmpA family protein [Nitrosomonas sp.]MBY0482991.1 OmpA family protein [Nitrosomonas sp.]
MNTPIYRFKKLIAITLTPVIFAACSTPIKPEGADMARSKLIQLQSDPQLASRAPVAIQEAELAVRAAEVPQEDVGLGKHLVFMADRKIDIATYQAHSRLSEDQRKMLSEQRDNARLDSRTREADRAHSDATAARREANLANMDTEIALQQAADLQRQIAELNAKATDRGLVVTLGDLLFDTGKATLKGGAAGHLGKLAAFLNQYPDRTVMIEGHTDNVGSEDYNLGLSQRRANSVMTYLVSQGVASNRLAAYGKGENFAISDNESASGRQQNRRVEIIIANTAARQ